MGDCVVFLSSVGASFVDVLFVFLFVFLFVCLEFVCVGEGGGLY